MDELFEVLTLVQTGKIAQVPIILFGKSYWQGLIGWITETMLNDAHNISPQDLNLFHITDDVDEVIDIVNKHYSSSKLTPNF
jgi:hypothetical protein